VTAWAENGKVEIKAIKIINFNFISDLLNNKRTIYYNRQVHQL